MFEKICNVIFMISILVMLVSFIVSLYTGGIFSISAKIAFASFVSCMLFGVILPELFD